MKSKIKLYKVLSFDSYFHVYKFIINGHPDKSGQAMEFNKFYSCQRQTSYPRLSRDYRELAC